MGGKLVVEKEIVYSVLKKCRVGGSRKEEVLETGGQNNRKYFSTFPISLIFFIFPQEESECTAKTEIRTSIYI